MNSSTNEKVSATRRKRTKRRQYLINPAFQWKYAATISFGVFVTSTIIRVTTFAVRLDITRTASSRLVSFLIIRGAITIPPLATTAAACAI